MPAGDDRKRVRVKTAKGRPLASKLWLERQLNDPYVARAKAEGFRSRAAFKLIEIDDKHHVLKPGGKVVDLGAAPGGWSQVAAKRVRAVGVLERLGFKIYDSGSAFYLWARIPEGHGDAMQLNERLIADAGVAAVPGSAFTDSDAWDDYLRICIAREDDILDSALGKLERALGS